MNEIEKAIQTPKIDVHCHVFRSDDWAASSDHLTTCSDTLGITENWCSSPILAGRLAPIEEVRAENDAILAAMARHPDRIRGLCFVIPGPDAIAEIERCLGAGMIGIKLYNQYRINDPIVRPIIELAVERRIPILEHAGAPNPEHKSNQPLISNGVHFADVNERYPDAILYHAHMGGGGDWEYTIRAIRDGSPNLYIDLSGSNLDYDQVGFAVDELGAERVLFGTDGTMAGGVGKVIEADITEEERDLIWFGNAERILGAQGLSPTPQSNSPIVSTQKVEVRGGGPRPTIATGDSTAGFALAPCPSAPPLPIDLNAWLGSYPFRSVRDTPDTLIARMDRFGIGKAAVSSIEAAFHRNVQPANEQLLVEIDGHRERLIPLATISPTYPKWEQDLARCLEAGARGVRLIPQYHGYRLTGPVGRDVIRAVTSANLPIFIPHRLEDARERHWMDSGGVVDLEEIAETIAAFPDTTFVINNARGIARSPLWKREDLRDACWYVDLSLAEIHYGLHREIDNARDLADIIDQGGADHFVFGTHQPFSYAASALVKLATLGVDQEQLDRIARKSALNILGLGDEASS
jgi:predicted TIM-barrel fold metal-dependent hydrolase